MLCYPPDPPLTFQWLAGLWAAHRRGGPSFVTLISAAGHIITGTAPNTQRSDNKGERQNYSTLSIIKHVITAQESIGGIRLYKSRGQKRTYRLHDCMRVCLSRTPALVQVSMRNEWGYRLQYQKKFMVIETTKCVWKCSQFDSAAKGHAIQFTLNAEYSSQQNTWKQMILSDPTATLSPQWIKAICWLLTKCIIFYLDFHLL